jgi:type II restriction/modification system DNA methylase subunit YeeA
MNTNRLKKFAQSARKLLLEDVSKRLLYWGIDSDGDVVQELTRTSGGYLFRGEVYNDQSIPHKWNSLISAIKRHSLEDVIEEAAYTWFNRLIAIKILEKNTFDPAVLAYVSEELSDPVLLQNAKKGILPSTDPTIVSELKQAVLESNDDELFSSLLIHYCRSHRLLNNIFGHINDYSELLIPQILLTKGGLLELINSEESISDEDYGEVELIGWLYQFYISDKKDEVFAGFKKKKKARAEDIPAATQIFTPKWIVNYLVENTVGRIWLDLHPESPIRETLQYLVEPENPTQNEPIINDVTELKVLDPAVGSGHFLVVAFDLLMQMYLEEGFSKRRAVESIIQQNLYGLDICPRAVGLANFAILLKAAQYHPNSLSDNHYPNVYAVPEPFDFTRQQIKIFLGTSDTSLSEEVHGVFNTLNKAQNIGSALFLELSGDARIQLQKSMDINPSDFTDLADQMTCQCILPFSKVASILTDHFPVVVANPPYMNSKYMNSDLVDYLKVNYPESKSDLFSSFIERALTLTVRNGLVGLVTPFVWMFLASYKNLRIKIVNNYRIASLIQLEYNAFEPAMVPVCTFVTQNSEPVPMSGVYIRLTSFRGSINQAPKALEAITDIKCDWRFELDQKLFNLIPGNSIAYWITKQELNLFNNTPLKTYADFKEGLTTANNAKFIRLWWEVDYSKITFSAKKSDWNMYWVPYNKGGKFRKWYGNNWYIVDWRENGGLIRKYPGSSFRNASFQFMFGSTFSALSSSKLSTRHSGHGFAFDSKGTMYFSEDKLSSITTLLNSNIFSNLLTYVSPTLDFRFGTIQELPLLEIEENNLEELVSISKNDWDDYETSWDFKCESYRELLAGDEKLEKAITEIQIFRSSNIQRMKELEENNNRAYIAKYHLMDVSTVDVPIDEITLTCNPCYRYENSKSEFEQKKLLSADMIREFVSYSVACIMGRYRLDKDGLNIAHPNPTEELSTYKYNSYNFEIDGDAIIPTMGSESPFSDDIVQRVQQFVLMIWGEKYYTENMNFINYTLGENLEKYLTKKFWNHHKKLYKNRPIYWQFASPKGAFKVITYMHRMNRFTMQVIRKNYLFKQMNWLEREIGSLVENEATLQTKESKRLDKLHNDLIECREYDLLLKDMADRQIEFDLDDGVVENYKLFEGVVSKI